MVLIEMDIIQEKMPLNGPAGTGDDHPAAGPTREAISFRSPRLQVNVTLNTTREIHDLPTFVEGLRPSHIAQPRYGLNADGSDHEPTTAIGFAYTYEQLQIQNGEKLTDFRVQTFWKNPQDTTWTKGDFAPGGYYRRADGSLFNGCEGAPAPNHDPAEDATYYVSTGFTVRKSDWNAPEVDFKFVPARPTAASAVRFVDLSNVRGQVVNWTWDFGDGTKAFDSDPSHRFTRPGRYQVSMVIRDQEGLQFTARKEVWIRNSPPVAHFILPATAKTGATVSLQDDSRDADGTIVSWSWFFGDGDVASGAKANHKFSHPGTFDVRLTITDDQGDSNSTVRQLSVNGGANSPAPDLAFPILTTFLVALGIQKWGRGK